MRTPVIIALLLLVCSCATTVDRGPVVIEPHSECPLCGMFPARYPRFHCQIIFTDGSYAAFDSAAGLLVYLHFPEKTGIVVKDIQAVYFKDFIKEIWIDARRTYFVFGSPVMGPMGLELLPVNTLTAAEKLIQQERGKEIVHFNEIDRNYLLKAADKGWLHYLAKKIVLE